MLRQFIGTIGTIQFRHMMNHLDTRATLLLRIRDLEDRNAWSEFVALYTPLIFSYALKRGLQEADAADVAQESICKIVRSIDGFEYDPAKGSFRGWLLTIALNQIRDRANKEKRAAKVAGDTKVFQQLLDQPSPEIDDQWEREYQLRLFHWAAERVESEFRPNTWKAFWQTTVLNEQIEHVSQSLGMSVGAVYIARSRVLARIRVVVAELEN